MKKYIIALALTPMFGLVACDADMGTEPGTDSTPAVTVYTYTPTDENLNPDNDVTVRFSTNSATSAVYYMYDLSTNADSLYEKEPSRLIEQVIAQGTKIDVNGASSVDVNLVDIHGKNTICAVAVGGTGKSLGRGYFTGLDWKDVTTGTFYVQQSFVGTDAVECSLQICTTDESLYRLNNPFGEGTAMKMQIIDVQGEDADGVYTLFRVPATDTPWNVRLSDGNTHSLWVEDIGYWQGNASFSTTVSGYECGFYEEDNSAFFQLAWMAGSVGCVSYTSPSFFIPD